MKLPALTDLNPGLYDSTIWNKNGSLYWGSIKLALPGAGGLTNDTNVEVGNSGELISVAKKNGFNLYLYQIASAINLRGLDAGKPVASSNNEGYFYFSTDIGGGTLYRSNGAAWDTESTGGGSPAVSNETPGGAMDGINTVFTTAGTFTAGSLEVFYRGTILRNGTDFTEAGGLNGFTLLFTPDSSGNDGWLICRYQP